MPKYHVQRSIKIDADPDTVYQKVADYGTWTTWSPWLLAEPDATVTMTDDTSSVGSGYTWKGQVVGEGEIEHKALEPGRQIDDEIRFLKPFKSVSRVTFNLEPASEGTDLTWHMRGSLPWFLFWMVPAMDTYVGMDYERGLKMLKEWIETGTIESKTDVHGVKPVGPMRMAGIRKQSTMAEIATVMEDAFCRASEIFAENNLPTDGDVLTVYHNIDLKNQTFDYTSGFTIPEPAGPVPASLSSWSIPKGNAFCVEHTGKYDHLGNAWSAAHQHLRYKKMKQSKAGAFEVYRNDPQETPTKDLRTEIFLPLR